MALQDSLVSHLVQENDTVYEGALPVNIAGIRASQVEAAADHRIDNNLNIGRRGLGLSRS